MLVGDRIETDPAIRFGKPCIAGTRIAVQDVVELAEAGLGPDEIRRDYYPDVTPEDIAAYVAYALGSGRIVG